jgi:hypothetical protein
MLGIALTLIVGFALGHGVREWAFCRDHSHQRRRSEVRRGSRGRLGATSMDCTGWIGIHLFFIGQIADDSL